MRKHMLAVAVLGSLAAVGCSHQSGSEAAKASVSGPSATGSSFFAGTGAARGRVASLPDRGDMLAYQSGEKAVSRGAYTLYPAQLSEARAMRAVAEGGMTVTAPDGHPIRLQYVNRVEHPDGNWTWIGRPVGSAPGTEALITFGEKAVFGTIPDGRGEPLQITTAAGRTWVVQADAAKLAALGPEPLPRDADLVVPRERVQQAMARAAARTATAASVPSVRAEGAVAQAAAVPSTATTTVDVVIGYTSGFASRLGGQSQALTRLQYLVDLGNQAYADSQVPGRIRMVDAIQVNYADATSNQSTLFQLSGLSCTTSATTASPRTPDVGADCTPAAVPSALQPLVASRMQHGADLVSLVRIFSDPDSGSCGVGWLIGAGQMPITRADAKYGISVVSDTSGNAFPSNNITCREVYLVHELGHNMGLQHDRQTAAGNDDTNGDGNALDPEEFGAFPYSFGMSTDTSNGNFYTIMSLRRTGQTGYAVFSNPDITTCGGFACGVADQEDNARALRQTLPIVASFAVPVANLWLRGDFDGDGKSDLLWRNSTTGANAIWKGANSATQQPVTTMNNFSWVVAAVGDFDGDHKADLLWRNSVTGANAIWRGASSSTQQPVTTMNNFAWVLAGTGDFDGDGKADILWRNMTTGANSIWKGASSTTQQPVTTLNNFAWTIAGIGDFDGDGKADIFWRNQATGANAIWKSASSSTQMPVTTVNNFDWIVGGVGDFDGDHKADILWRNVKTGALTIWKGGNSANQIAVTRLNNLAWFIAGIGDFDGDGKADILWRNMMTGANTVWKSGSSATQMTVSTLNNFAWFIAG